MIARGKYRKLLQDMAQLAFQVAGDICETVVYTAVSGSSYDPVAGVSTVTSKTFTFMGTISRLAIDEVDPKVSSRSSTESVRSPGVVTTEAKLSCAYLDLPIIPTTQDTLTVLGRTWKVGKVLSPPGNPLWSIRIEVV